MAVGKETKPMPRRMRDDGARQRTCLFRGPPSGLQNDGEASEADASPCTVVRPEGIGTAVPSVA